MQRSINSSYWLWLPNKDTNCTVSNTPLSCSKKKNHIHNHAEPEMDFFFCNIQTERENKEKCNSWLQIISQLKGREAVAQLDYRGFTDYWHQTNTNGWAIERIGTTFMRANKMWKRELALLLNTVTGLEADERGVLFGSQVRLHFGALCLVRWKPSAQLFSLLLHPQPPLMELIYAKRYWG